MKKNNPFAACLLGGAIGDALGYPVEFLHKRSIQMQYGSDGITDLQLDKKTGKVLISDDTQMTLFTANGLLSAGKKKTDFSGYDLYPSYLLWCKTQMYDQSQLPQHEEILNHKELLVRRDPGNTCLASLESGKCGTIEDPLNYSKGCGGIMRVAPIGLFFHNSPKTAFEIGCQSAAITHGNPTGFLSAGAMAAIIAQLINGKNLIESILSTIEILKNYPGWSSVLLAISKAYTLSESNKNTSDAIKIIGEGWVAEETLALALYCALKESDFKKALILAVNHDGDSDSVGAVCGNILGAWHGMNALPADWINNIELKDYILKLSEKLDSRNKPEKGTQK